MKDIKTIITVDKVEDRYNVIWNKDLYDKIFEKGNEEEANIATDIVNLIINFIEKVENKEK